MDRYLGTIFDPMVLGAAIIAPTIASFAKGVELVVAAAVVVVVVVVASPSCP